MLSGERTKLFSYFRTKTIQPLIVHVVVVSFIALSINTLIAYNKYRHNSICIQDNHNEITLITI